MYDGVVIQYHVYSHSMGVRCAQRNHCMRGLATLGFVLWSGKEPTKVRN